MNLRLNEDKEDILEQTDINRALFLKIWFHVFHLPCSQFHGARLGMGFPCYGRQAGDFFKASNPLGPSLLQQLVPLLGSTSWSSTNILATNKQQTSNKQATNKQQTNNKHLSPICYSSWYLFFCSTFWSPTNIGLLSTYATYIIMSLFSKRLYIHVSFFVELLRLITVSKHAVVNNSTLVRMQWQSKWLI